jgi:hypothetical protein
MEHLNAPTLGIPSQSLASLLQAAHPDGGQEHPFQWRFDCPGIAYFPGIDHPDLYREIIVVFLGGLSTTRVWLTSNVVSRAK